MIKYNFFENLPKIINIKLINKFSNILPKKSIKISKKLYKSYTSSVKQYRYLGIIPIKTIKFVKIK